MRLALAFLTLVCSFCSMAETQVVYFNSGVVAQNEIGAAGGSVQLPSVAQVIFPTEAFPSKTQITLQATTSPEISQLFLDTASIFDPINFYTNEIRVGAGMSRPLSDNIKVSLQVPEAIKSQLVAGSSPSVFVAIEQGGADELPYTLFEIIESSYNQQSSQVHFELFPFAFAKNQLTQGEFQAIVVVAVLNKN